MPTQKMPITEEVTPTPQIQGAKAYVTACDNLIPTDTGNQLVRPGFAYYGNSNQGNYWTQVRTDPNIYEAGKVNVNNYLFRLTYPANIWTLTQMGAIAQSTGNFPFSYAQDGNTWVCCKGQDMSCGAVSDAVIDTVTTHPLLGGNNADILKVIFANGRFLALNNGYPEVYYTEAATLTDPTTWPADNSFAPFQGSQIGYDMATVAGQVVVMGVTKTEVWMDDGVSPFTLASGGTIDVGAHYYGGSSVRAKGVLYWITNTYDLARYDGGSFSIVPNPYASELDVGPAFCVSSYFRVWGQDILLFSFPAQASYAYNISANRWSKWSHYVNDTTFAKFGVTSLGMYPPAGTSVFCGTDEGRYVLVNVNGATDALRSDDSRTHTVYGHKETGWLDYGTTKDKVSEEIRVRVRNDVDGVLRFKWSNNPGEADRPDIRIETDGTSVYGIVKHIKRCGTYKARKYNMFITGVRAAFSDIEEDVEVPE